MANNQHQDFWLVGGRFYFKPDGQDTLFDIGVLSSTSLSPTVSPEVIELQDPDTGVLQSVDEAPSSVSTSWDIQTHNCSLDNFSFLMLSSEPEDYGQSLFTPSFPSVVAKRNRFLKLLDNEGQGAYMTKILGAYTGAGAVVAITSATASSGVILGNFAGATAFLVPGKTVYLLPIIGGNMVEGDVIAATLNGAGSATQITINQQLSQDYAGTDMSVLVPQTEAIRGVDWAATQQDEDRGMLRVLGDSTVLNDTACTPVFVQREIATARRMIRPQFRNSAVQGTGYIFYSRQGNSFQTAQECRMSLTPASTALDVENYSSMSFAAKLLADPTNAKYPGGRMLQFKGEPPKITS